MTETSKRWKVIAVYRSENGPVDVEHFVEELEDIQEIIERGPDWNCLTSLSITLNRRFPQYENLTVEQAAKL